MAAMHSSAEAAILRIMSRRASRLAAALLWLALALLPLRGLAGALMPVVMMSGADPAAEVAVMPCHGSMAMSDDVAQDGSTATQTCSMCSLCHGTALHATVPLSVPAAPHESQPRAATRGPIEPRAPDGLFRPPRTDLA
jgi:hypothetical protein